MSRSDNKLAALETLTGNTGHVNDLEREWLESAVAAPAGTSLNDLWLQLFLENGATAATFNDAAYEFLEAAGFTEGTLSGRWAAYWAAGGGTGALTEAEYENYAAAVASGDTWAEGAVITLTDPTPDVEMVYLSALEVDGHSGLIHRDPFDESGTLTAASLINSEAANTDPDAWIAGDWTDGGVGTQGVDYEYDTNGGKARLRTLSASDTNKGRVNGPAATASHTKTFFIVDAAEMSITNANSDSSVFGGIILGAYVDGAGGDVVTSIRLIDDGTENWVYLKSGPTNADTGIPAGTAARLWVYAQNGQLTIWEDDAAAPTVNDSSPFTSTASTVAGLQVNASSTNTRDSTLKLGYHLHGNMTIT